MKSVSEALAIVTAARPVFITELVDLQATIHRTLAENISADRPFPPFNRVSMDGYAVAFQPDIHTWKIAATQFAGEPPHTLAHTLEAIEVMTGAVLPTGTDTVIRYEDTTADAGSASLTMGITLSRGQNVHALGQDIPEGQVLLRIGQKINSSAIGVLASVGKTVVSVEARPRIALVSTGDELVEVSQTPMPYQIRRSSVYQLQAALAGYETTLAHLPDDPNLIEKTLENLLLTHEILLLTGGISAGKKDFLPEILTRLGVEKRFHGVAQRPGKPLWFGMKNHKAVFALPGNPVSSFVCFLKYVKPFLGIEAPKQQVVLGETINFTPKLHYFLPVSVASREDGFLVATPFRGSGSGDFANLLACTGFLELPPEKSIFQAGEVFEYLPF